MLGVYVLVAVATLDALLSAFCAGFWIFQGLSFPTSSAGAHVMRTIAFTGVALLVYRVLYGVTCAIVPCTDNTSTHGDVVLKEDAREAHANEEDHVHAHDDGAHSAMHRRAARMGQQGGHSLMLVYFTGLGAVAETFLFCRRGKPAQGVAKIARALRIHAFRFVLVEAVAHILVLMLLFNAVPAPLAQLLGLGPTSGNTSALFAAHTMVTLRWALVSFSSVSLVAALVLIPGALCTRWSADAWSVSSTASTKKSD